MAYLKDLGETGVAVIVAGPVFGQFAADAQSLRLGAGEHEHVAVATRTIQGIGQKTRMVLIGQNDHLAGGAVLNVPQELADRVDLRLIKLKKN